MQQTIKSQEGSLVTYKLFQLVKFYHSTLEQTIGAEAGLTKVLSECAGLQCYSVNRRHAAHRLSASAQEAFFGTLETHSRSLLRFIQPPASDLSPPLMLRDTLTTLRDVLTVQKASAAELNPTEVTGEADELLDASLEPAMEMCTRMGEQRPSTWDRSVFAINCIAFVQVRPAATSWAIASELDAQALLEPFPQVAPKRVNSLDEQVRRHVETLTGEHVRLLVSSRHRVLSLQYSPRTSFAILASTLSSSRSRSEPQTTPHPSPTFPKPPPVSSAKPCAPSTGSLRPSTSYLIPDSRSSLHLA